MHGLHIAIALAVGAAVMAYWMVLAPVGEQVGRYLVVDPPPEPAAAIVVLAGGVPDREGEAATLYRQGFAPYVVIVREWIGVEAERTRADHRDWTWEGRLAYLQRHGVPLSAIKIADQPSCMTYDELELASGVVANLPQGSGVQGAAPPVILVTSAYHTRRTMEHWTNIQAGLPEAARRTAMPHAAPEADFSTTSWWLHRRSTMRVAREYVGLLTARLTLPARRAPCGEDYLIATKLYSRLLGQ